MVQCRVLFVTEKFGDLGNRLFRYARLLASKTPRVAVVDLSFFQYSWMFRPVPFFYRALFGFISCFGRHALTLLNGPMAGEIPVAGAGQEHGPVFCRDVFQSLGASSARIQRLAKGGYFARAETPDAGCLDKLQQIFRLKPHFTERAGCLLRDGVGFSKIVGMHIRRGDYRTFADGAWYFDNAVYTRVMHELKSSFRGPGEVGFLLVSDEALGISDFSPLEPLYFGKSDPGLDQALLSMCHAIVGAESTFNAWPAFLHKIPRAVIANSSTHIGWEDFHTTDINYFPGEANRG
jgi:hypothetical protein